MEEEPAAEMPAQAEEKEEKTEESSEKIEGGETK